MTNTALRILFAGTPEFSARHLQALLASEHEIVAVYTQPDRPAGRGKKLQASPVKQLAETAGIPVEQPASLRDEEVQQTLANYAADVMVVVAYGLILPQAVLDTPALGCLNVHASLLPRWRGAAPIQRAIEAGDPQTGVTIMQMDAGLDTGAMLATAERAIAAETTSADMLEELAESGPAALLAVLADLPQYQSKAITQDDELATYAEKIQKIEGLLDWSLSAEELRRKVCAFNPFPVCYSLLAGERVKIWNARALDDTNAQAAPGTIVSADREGIAVSCGTGALLITQLQLPGGKSLPTEAMLNSRRDQFAIGQCFDNPD
ncbi:MAG: methionyl-tRNA formyltransferase [Halieaceae bacterium]